MESGIHSVEIGIQDSLGLPYMRRDRGSHCLNYEEWLKKLEDTSPAIEAEGQNTMSVSTTKLLENGRDSETSTARVKHSCRCRRCRPRNFPFLTS